MRLKHLIKTITHSWGASAKIMKQSKQVPNKLPRRKEGRIFFRLFRAKLTLVSLHSLWPCVLTDPNVEIEIGRHVNGVESLSQLFECCSYHFVRNL